MSSLTGINALDLTHAFAGPLCTMLLAELDFGEAEIEAFYRDGLALETR